MKFHNSVTIGGMVLAPGVVFSAANGVGGYTAYEVAAVMAMSDAVVIFLSLGTTYIFRMRNGETNGPPRIGNVAHREGKVRRTMPRR